MKRICAIFLASGALIGAASAQNSLSAASNVATSFDLTTVKGLLDPYYESIEFADLGGRQAIAIRRDGAVVALTENQCDRDGANCKGLYMQAFFGYGPTTAVVNEFNSNAFVVAAVTTPGQSSRIYRYLIADAGYVPLSLVANVENFFAGARRYYEQTSNPDANTIAWSAEDQRAAHETPRPPAIASNDADLVRKISVIDVPADWLFESGVEAASNKIDK